ncbi:Amidase [Sphaerobacter thermophilus DSM 20745]|uniref:Amidase n=2 Tax=Sphaerobacter TaxID=2056 RepID=D1CA50_SPHTD|nr:Amidase [Sphaerobacter thermophilus DSM 20745]
MNRRSFIGLVMFATMAPTLARWAQAVPPAALQRRTGGDVDLANLEEVTIAELQAAMEEGEFTAVELVNAYIERIEAIDQDGPRLNSILEINPDALDIAQALDEERRTSGARSPLHGIPILLKDNIDTADRMRTTAGSLALMNSTPARDAFIVQRLRDAGAVILGKTNMSEWANFRSTRSSSGWSGRGGQCKNPYILDRNPCGSSSGSGAATAANLTAGSIGTETDGSIVCPATANGVVGIKPTVGLLSRSGIIPISHNQDTPGPHARVVADAAAILGAMVGVDPEDPATAPSEGRAYTDYTQFLDPNGLQGARIGVARQSVTGYSEETDRLFEQAIQAMRDAGATIIDPADIPTINEITTGPTELTVLLYDFKHDLNAYLAARNDPDIRTLADLIAFNEENAEQELRWFGQELFLMAQEKGELTDPEYIEALETNHRLGRTEGIDAVLQAHQLDAIVAPTGSPAWTTDLVNGDHFLGASSSPAAIAGYPLISVPMGFAFGLPVNITFMGTAWSEPTLIRLAYAFEQATKVRRPPQFLPTLAE